MKIFDTSSIVCIFREIDYPEIFDLCIKYGYSLNVTQAVYDEIQKNLETAKEFNSRCDFTIINEDFQECSKKLQKRYPWLHDGELSVLCFGKKMDEIEQKYHCIIDERARKLKKPLNLKINGTVGLLKWQKELGEIDQLNCQNLYNKLTQSSFWISDTIARELLD